PHNSHYEGEPTTILLVILNRTRCWNTPANSHHFHFQNPHSGLYQQMRRSFYSATAKIQNTHPTSNQHPPRNKANIHHYHRPAPNSNILCRVKRSDPQKDLPGCCCSKRLHRRLNWWYFG